MDTAAPLPLAECFIRIIHFVACGLGNRLRAHAFLGPAVPVALINLIGARLDKLRRRFLALLEGIEAGTLPKLPERGTARKRKPSAAAAKPRPNLLAECGVRECWGWVMGIACTGYIGDFQRLLERPDMQAMIAAEPRRVGRILRPLCRMLGTHEIPDLLRLPSQADIVTVDWAAHARMVEAEKAAHAAGLPPPAWPPLPPSRKAPFRFYLTRYGQPLLE
ncbi:MAG TPA: hypothetical protein VHS58_00055 [Acetobacteraceae bacterium]|nr:hypothetical protein [Acetobacteraceae bacterium]